MLAQRLDLIFVVQCACPVDNEIDLLLAVVEYGLTIATCIHGDCAEASYGLEGSILFITFSENRPVVASCRGKISLHLH
jgi:hypothetical protein